MHRHDTEQLAHRRERKMALVGIALLIPVALAVGLLAGSSGFGLPGGSDIQREVILAMRWDRVLCGLLVGAALAVSGRKRASTSCATRAFIWALLRWAHCDCAGTPAASVRRSHRRLGRSKGQWVLTDLRAESLFWSMRAVRTESSDASPSQLTRNSKL